jgi:hypothetical protein
MPRSRYTNEWYYSRAEMELAEAEARRKVESARQGITITTERRGDVMITTETRRDLFGNVVQTVVTEERVRPEPLRLPPEPLTDKEAEVVVGTTIAVAGLALLGSLFAGGKD